MKMTGLKSELSLGVLFLVFAPFFQGLYFDYQKYMLLIVALVMIIVSIKNKKIIEIIDNPIHWYCFGTLCLGLFTLVVAVDKGMHGLSLLTMVLPSLIILHIQHMERKRILNWMVLTTFINATIGVVIFMYTRGEADSVFKFIQKGRLGGSFQYANTYALFIGIGIMLLLVSEQTFVKKKYMYDFMIIMMGLALVLTMSRSGIFLITFGLFILGVSFKKFRLLFSCVLGGFLGMLIINFWVITKQVERLYEGTSASEWQTRLLYYQDAWRIIVDHPLGLGHLGYYYIQRQYQTGSQYYVKFVHSAFIQHILDLGWLAGLLMMLLALFIVMTKKIKWPYKFIILVVVLHSLVDIHFQFPVMILWIGLVYQLGVKQKKSYLINISEKRHRFAALVALISITIMSTYLLMPTFFFQLSHYKLAVNLYPAYYEANRQLLKSNQLNPIDKNEVALRMERNNRYPLEVFVYKRDLAMLLRDYEEAIVYSQKCIVLNPLKMAHYESYGRSLYEYARLEKDIKKQLEALQKCLEIPERLLLLANERNTDYNVMHKPTYKPTIMLLEILEDAKELGLLLER